MTAKSNAGEPKLVSMKLPKEKKGAEKMYPSMDSPEYPYGLRINLDDQQLEQLGIKGLPAVGTEMTFDARVKVCAVRQSDSDQGGSSRSIELQITDLGLDS